MRAAARIVVALGLALAARESLAAPAPSGIAINPQTKECGGYWAGDEDVRYALPPGWKDYYPDYAKDPDRIVTEYGTCVFDQLREQSCCEALGLTFVGEVGQKQGCAIGGPPAASALGPLLVFVLWLGLRRR